MPPALTSLQFFDRLKWLDGRNLLDTIEPYRRNIFTKALDSYLPMASRKSTSCWPAEAKKLENGRSLFRLGLLPSLSRELAGFAWIHPCERY